MSTRSLNNFLFDLKKENSENIQIKEEEEYKSEQQTSKNKEESQINTTTCNNDISEEKIINIINNFHNELENKFVKKFDLNCLSNYSIEQLNYIHNKIKYVISNNSIKYLMKLNEKQKI